MQSLSPLARHAARPLRLRQLPHHSAARLASSSSRSITTSVDRVAVIGAGQMGVGIAYVASKVSGPGAPKERGRLADHPPACDGRPQASTFSSRTARNRNSQRACTLSTRCSARKSKRGSSATERRTRSGRGSEAQRRTDSRVESLATSTWPSRQVPKARMEDCATEKIRSLIVLDGCGNIAGRQRVAPHQAGHLCQPRDAPPPARYPRQQHVFDLVVNLGGIGRQSVWREPREPSRRVPLLCVQTPPFPLVAASVGLIRSSGPKLTPQCAGHSQPGAGHEVGRAHPGAPD